MFKNQLTLKKSDFYQQLHEVLSPSSPIDSVEYLQGREKELNSIENALYARGRHAFVMGDRGVGKSSLAQTAAHLIQSSDNQPIIVTCSHTSTLSSVVLSAVSIALNSLNKKESQTKVAVNLPFLQYEHSQSHSNLPQLPESIDLSNAVYSLASLCEWHSKLPVIVIDEFDLIAEDERRNFGVLLKQLGDQHVNVKLIFTGIGQSLNDLMAGHLSSFRQIHEVKLEALNWDARFEIIDKAAEKFGVTIPDDIRHKIAGLSDGFPSYIHLICEKLLIETYVSKDEIDIVSLSLFIKALDEAIHSVSETLRQGYNKATEGRDEHMHNILWAMADSSDLQRHMDHILESYAGITEQLGISPIDEKTFKREFTKLRKPNHGEVIKKAFDNRPNWFAFSENVIRGFIRMCAEKNQVELDFGRAFTAITATARSTGPRTSYRPLNSVESGADRMRREY